MRALKVLVVVMGVLIVGGTVALGVVIARRLSTGGAAAGPVTLDEPAGTRIAGAAASGDQVVLQLQGGGPDRVVVVEMRSGRVVARIGLAR